MQTRTILQVKWCVYIYIYIYIYIYTYMYMYVYIDIYLVVFRLEKGIILTNVFMEVS